MNNKLALVLPLLSLLAIAGAANVVGCGSNNSEFDAGTGVGDEGGTGLDGGSPGTMDAAPDPMMGILGGGDGGARGDGGLAACATQTSKAEKLPLDMAIGLDTSFSMDFYNKWPSVQAALKSFVKNPAYSDLGLALQFFPIRKQCSVPDYQAPAVPMALLPTVSQPVTVALDAQMMSGGTPMVPLLQGLSAYLKAYAATQTMRKPVLVLATDGIPDDACSGTSEGMANTLDNAVAVAAAAAAGTPPVETFVIGVGSELTALNAIAAAGGTGTATLVDVSMGQNVEAAFLQALDNIRKTAIPCDYDIPASSGTIDFTKVNVTYTPASGVSQVLVYVTDTAGCAKAPNNGWYFDNAAAPKKVVLCGGTCDEVKADDEGRVDVVFGCSRIDVH